MISDLHLGHKNILKYDTQFQSIQEREEKLIDDWNSVVHKRDVVYVLGDALFDYYHARVIAKLKGRKLLIMGNHDTLPAAQYLSVFDDIRGPITYKKTWLSHQPIHPSELRGRCNIHGHLHGGQAIKDYRYFNVCVDSIGFAPMLFEEIVAHFKRTGAMT